MRWKLLALAIALYPYTGAFAVGPSPQSLVPSLLITRAEAVYRLVESDAELRERVIAFRSHMPPLPLFHDVPQEDALAPYLEVAFEEGIIVGNPARLFHPGEALRTNEAEDMIRHLHGEGDPEREGDIIFFVQPIARENFLALLQENPSSIFPANSPAFADATAGKQFFSSVPTLPTIPTLPTLPTPPSNLFAISLPTLGIDSLTVKHPKDPLTHTGIIEPLKNGVGHLFSFPGGGGKVFIYGHSSGYPWDLSEYTRIFRKVNRLTVGDPIHIAYQGQRFTYQVTGKETVRANDLHLLQEEGEEEELILYTCWPPDSTSERLLVRARPVQNILPLPAGEGA